MTSQTANPDDFNTEMKKNELGDYIIKNKAIVIGLCLLIVGLIAGYGIFNHLESKTNNEAATFAYNFTQNEVATYQKTKTNSAELVTKFTTDGSKFVSTTPYFTGALAIFDMLVAEGKFQDAKNVLEGLKSKNVYQSFFLETRKAAVFEELGDVDGAIQSLTLLTQADLKLMEGKVYLDLGRMYLLKGNKDMAKKSFEYVNTTDTQKVFKSLATQYLQSL